MRWPPRLDNRHVSRGREGRGGHGGPRAGRRDIRGRAPDRVAQGRVAGRGRGAVRGLLRAGRSDRMSGGLRTSGVRPTVFRPARTLGRVPVRAPAAARGRPAVVDRRLQRHSAGQGPAGLSGRPVRVLPGRAAEEAVGPTGVRGTGVSGRLTGRVGGPRLGVGSSKFHPNCVCTKNTALGGRPTRIHVSSVPSESATRRRSTWPEKFSTGKKRSRKSDKKLFVP